MPDTAWAVTQVTPKLVPRATSIPQFRCRLVGFDTSSVVRFRSPSRLTPDVLSARLFLQRSPLWLLTSAACSGLQSPPARAIAEDHTSIANKTRHDLLQASTSLARHASWHTKWPHLRQTNPYVEWLRDLPTKGERNDEDGAIRGYPS